MCPVFFCAHLNRRGAARRQENEPMNGLDNQGVNDVRNILLGLKKEGKTVILASHNKEDIEILCSTVYEMGHGRLV